MRQSDDDKRRERERAERIKAAQHKDLIALLGDAAFRRYLRRYLGLTHIFRTTFTPNSASETFFKEGQRSIGTTMFGEVMEAVPSGFQQLMAERMPEDDED